MSEGLYERDVLAWSQHQADLLRRLGRGERVNEVDWAQIAEEIEDLGLFELRSVESFAQPDDGSSVEDPGLAEQFGDRPLGRGNRRLSAER